MPSRSEPPIGMYRPLENPATRETYEFLETGFDNDGERLRMRWTFAPGGRVPRHMHPFQTESFVVEAGELEFRVGKEKIVASPGDRLSVAPGVYHGIRNRSGTAAHAVVEKTPAGESKFFYEALAGMARDGLTVGAGFPRNPVRAAVFADGFADVFRLGYVPYPLQRVATYPLAAIGNKLGYRRTQAAYSADLRSPGQ